MKSLKDCQDIVCKKTTWYKGTLRVRDDIS